MSSTIHSPYYLYKSHYTSLFAMKGRGPSGKDWRR